MGKICAEIADIFTENSRPKDPAVRKRFGQIEILKKFVQISIIARIFVQEINFLQHKNFTFTVWGLRQGPSIVNPVPLWKVCIVQLRSRAYAVFKISGALF